ncbi:MAG: hypothetical protein ACFE8A_02950 [Candidatus Hodarchaeota archaeon]
MEIPSIIEKEFLKANIEKIGWKGKGTKDSPLIIDDDNLPYNVIFKTDDLYLHLRNIDIGIMILDKCQNIIIEDSIISLVKLKSCENVIIKNNLMRTIKVYFGKRNTIENNRIYSAYNRRLFTIIIFIVALASGLLSLISYIIESYLLRDLMVALLICCILIFSIELAGKKSKRYLPKKFKKNEFLKFRDEKISLNHELDENFSV